MQPGDKPLCSLIHKLTLFRMKNNCHSSGNTVLCLFIKESMNLTALIVEEYLSYQLHAKWYSAFFSEG
jgi:hypothetical protein